MDTIIEKVFVRNIVSSVIVICGLAAVLLFIKHMLKGNKHFRLIITIGLTVSVAIAAVLGTGLLKIYLDIKNEDYVTYSGVYIERGGGQQELKTVIVYDENGNEIRLLRTGSSQEGSFEGTVVYGRRSRIVVEYKGIPN
mgnify:CR=1 FL=1